MFGSSCQHFLRCTSLHVPKRFERCSFVQLVLAAHLSLQGGITQTEIVLLPLKHSAPVLHSFLKTKPEDRLSVGRMIAQTQERFLKGGAPKANFQIGHIVELMGADSVRLRHSLEGSSSELWTPFGYELHHGTKH